MARIFQKLSLRTILPVTPSKPEPTRRSSPAGSPRHKAAARSPRTGSRPHPPRRQLSREQIASLVSSASSIISVLATTDPADKAEAYQQLGLALTYHPQGIKVQVTARASSHVRKDVSEGRVAADARVTSVSPSPARSGGPSSSATVAAASTAAAPSIFSMTTSPCTPPMASALVPPETAVPALGAVRGRGHQPVLTPAVTLVVNSGLCGEAEFEACQVAGSLPVQRGAGPVGVQPEEVERAGHVDVVEAGFR